MFLIRGNEGCPGPLQFRAYYCYEFCEKRKPIKALYVAGLESTESHRRYGVIIGEYLMSSFVGSSFLKRARFLLCLSEGKGLLNW